MIKKILLSTAGLFALVVIGVIAFEFFQKPKIGNTLSERSKEFIEKQKVEEGSSKFNNLVAEKGEDFKGKRITVDDCFSFVMPYSVFNQRQEGECSGYFAFERPRGTIVAFMEKATSASIDDASGVSMRRLESEKYEEKKYEIDGRSFVGFVDKTNTYSITTYHYISEKYFILTLKLPEENEKALREILASLEFY